MAKKSLFYDPYLETVGGGERYTFCLIDCLIKKGWQIDFPWTGPNLGQLKKKFRSRLNFDLDSINFIGDSDGILKKITGQRKYDLIFWLSDGSVPFLFGKNNILHCQIPFHGVGGGSFLNQVKLKTITNIVCNSNFTKRFIDREYRVNSKVIYPPVDTDSFRPGKKENIILSVGRFSQLLQAKRQDILVQAFKAAVDDGVKGWRLFLAGGTDVGGKDFLADLKRASMGYPIEFYENCTFDTLKELYSKAKIFWHAAGYGVDEEKEPEKTEHFGITVVEAMAAGCIPFVVGKGGLRETVEEGITGYFWEEPQELAQKLSSLIYDEKKMNEIIPKVIKSSQKFSNERFCEEFSKIIG